MTPKFKVLFVCIHNSARSQMAEAFLKHYGGSDFEVHSAGLEPGKLNPVVVEAMRQAGIDISGNRTKSVDEYLRSGEQFTHVITVCDETSAERCPVFPGPTKRLHWGFRDPSSLSGTPEEKLQETIKIRDEISTRVRNWVSELQVNFNQD